MSPHTIIEELADGFGEEAHQCICALLPEEANRLRRIESALRRAADNLKPKEPVDDYDAALAAMHEQQCAKETPPNE